jgi:hypothetical protein
LRGLRNANVPVILFVLKCKIVEIVINVKVMVLWDVTLCGLVGV